MSAQDLIAADGAAERPRWRSAARLVWLVYLGIYFGPWFVQPPTRLGVVLSLVAVAVFLGVYFDAYRREGARTIPHVVAMAAIGFLLSPLGGAWSVFNVYASSLAARALDRRAAVVALVLLQATLVGFGLAVRAPWEVWASGVFFGAMTGFGVLLQADLEARNRRLVTAQGEVRRLAASAERERIGRDLHDLLGHTLTLVAVKADLAARLCDRDPLAARREMDEVAAAARDALGEVRTAVVGMNGASLALEIERARVMLAAAKVDAQIRADASPPDARREAVLAMALREAVTNVIRHAGATCCTIGVDADASGLRLSVRDDGRGGDGIREGSGLSGMRARLVAAGGRLEVESGAGGTRLTAWLPELAA